MSTKVCCTGSLQSHVTQRGRAGSVAAATLASSCSGKTFQQLALEKHLQRPALIKRRLQTLKQIISFTCNSIFLPRVEDIDIKRGHFTPKHGAEHSEPARR
ncbi:hypothetical protein JOB18_026313 [Solea senegalensis]|uniref:Uncharacterized protein n=1 Tax=Solea senegalensis TaxID=28829 RepID=A0AAV6PWU0_SOLSE|nr:hypothetical protein JOB18_026313 [Solea senegalensis]